MILNIKKRKWPAMFIILTVMYAGCYYDKEELLYPGNNSNQPGDCATSPASFSVDVLPLIKSNCAVSGCHDATAAGGFSFQNYSQISGAKELINVQAVIQKTMPPNGPLSPDEIKKLKCWIEGGGLNN